MPLKYWSGTFSVYELSICNLSWLQSWSHAFYCFYKPNSWQKLFLSIPFVSPGATRIPLFISFYFWDSLCLTVSPKMHLCFWALSLPHYPCRLDSSHALLFSISSFLSRNYCVSFLSQEGKEGKEGRNKKNQRGGQRISMSHLSSFTDLKHFRVSWTKAEGHLTGWFSQRCSCDSERQLWTNSAGAEWELVCLAALKLTSCRKLAMLSSMLCSTILLRFFHFPRCLRLLIYLDS